MRSLLIMALCVLTGASEAGGAEADRRTLKDNPEQEYYVFTPRKIDPEKTYWLVVGVHGLGGSGHNAMGWKDFAEKADCIVVGPTFKGPFQFPRRGAGKTMLAIVAELRKQYKLHGKMFVTGFSAGAQFVHRFALENPRYVIACAAHSAGSWGTPRGGGRSVLFLITCGEEDRTRIDGARKFANELTEKRYRVESKWFPGVGHSICGEARELTEALFWRATTGMTPTERERVEGQLNRGGDLVIAEKYQEAMEVFRKIAASKPTSTYTERAEAGLKQIDEIGRKKLTELEALAEEDFRKAVPALEELQRQFKGSAAAPDIARFIIKLRKRPEAAAEFKRLADAKDAEDLYTRAEKLLEKKEHAQAVGLLRKAARFAETEFGKKAAAKLKEIGAEPASTPKTRPTGSTKDCARWLQMAKNYVAAGRPDAARPLLQKIIENHPDAPEAQEAKKMLEKL